MAKECQNLHYAEGFADDIPSESPFAHHMSRLFQDINISDLSSVNGTTFEIASDQEDIGEFRGSSSDLFCDESLISSLSLGAGNGEFDENEDSCSDDDKEPFEKMALKMEDIIGDGGVLKMEVNPGVGGDIPSGAFVTFHYSAFIEYNDEPFDSTHLRGKPERKKLDDNDLLPGVNIALKTMRKNETSRFLIRPQYAFGKTGCQPRIPGNETIFFEINILSYVDAYAADVFEEQNHQAVTFQEKLEGARGFHRKGNGLYREGNLIAAKNAYTRAAWIMEDAKLKNEEEEKQRCSILMKVRSNLAQVYLDLKEPANACTQCKLALSVTGVHSDDLLSKIYYRFGKAKTMLCDFAGALKELRRAQKLKTHNADIATALESLLIKKDKYEAQEKFIFKRMFQSNSTERERPIEGSSSKIGKKPKNIEVRPEFEQVVKTQMIDFAADVNIKELPFPSNLSQSEIAFVAATAKELNLLVTLQQKGRECKLQVTKK